MIGAILAFAGAAIAGFLLIVVMLAMVVFFNQTRERCTGRPEIVPARFSTLPPMPHPSYARSSCNMQLYPNMGVRV